ncbi:MAG: Crp/Fnr family transcriptional regulator [Clostridiales bacterium]|nr:Crp/Fnr family transcriptional regulator [Clostridiales bacterium]
MNEAALLDVIRINPLFEGMSDAEAEAELMNFDAKRQDYSRGETVLQLGGPVTRFGLLISGSVQVMTDDINGHHMIMATIEPGQSFAESLCIQNTLESPVYAQAIQPSSILWLSPQRLRTSPCFRFMLMLSRKTLSMNDRIQVLSKLTLRDKLLTLFSLLSITQGNEILLPFDRESLAAYLGANRTAVSREMSRMRDEGLIDFTKSTVKLLTHII